jgi:2,3-dihydroxybenzoate decarboxylase
LSRIWPNCLARNSTKTETTLDVERNCDLDGCAMIRRRNRATFESSEVPDFMSPTPSVAQVPYQRIATEEAWGPPEMFARYRRMLTAKSVDDPGFNSMWGFYLLSGSERATQIVERLQDIGQRRIGDMDATGIAKQVMSLTSPGVQVFESAEAVALAASSNDQLAEAIRRHPDRLTGLAAVAPQDPAAAAKELERGVRKLGLKGAIVNSHTLGAYLDEPKFWEIFAAAEALDVPVYIHPNTPSKGLIGPLLARGLEGAIYGFAVDTGMHLLGIITAGVFDRFPKLRIVVGHLGEALPFWLFRIDYMHRASVQAQRYACMKPLKRKPSEYLRENVYITTSGVAWPPAIRFCQEVLGMERVLYAMDYPYQFVADEVTATDSIQISAADKKKLFQSNAETVFAL